jgi:secreted trypsin-like serine protease
MRFHKPFLAVLAFAFFAASAAATAQTVCKDDRKIVGGVATDIKENPWQVLLSIPWPGGNSALCGGSLIQDRWVLTAAHCFPPQNPASPSVKAGVTNRESGSWIGTGKVFVHEGYHNDTHENDIALVKLNGGVAGDIIPLAQGGEALRPCEMLEVTGWGAIKEDGTAAATILQKAEVPLVDNATCNAKDAYNGAVKAGMMCAGYRDGGIDSCQGDSGGPLVWRGKDGPVLVGVVSWGEGCARKLRYGVYTRVDAYSGWIADTILANRN